MSNVTNTKLSSLDELSRVRYCPKTHEDIFYLFRTYDDTFNEIKCIVNERKPITNERGEYMTLTEIENLINGYKIKLDKLRLMIERKIYRTTNVHKRTNVGYIVFRSFWVDENGQRFRFFSKNIGAEHKALIDGEIPEYKMREVRREMLMMMKEQFNLEYGTNL